MDWAPTRETDASHGARWNGCQLRGKRTLPTGAYGLAFSYEGNGHIDFPPNFPRHHRRLSRQGERAPCHAVLSWQRIGAYESKCIIERMGPDDSGSAPDRNRSADPPAIRSAIAHTMPENPRPQGRPLPSWRHRPGNRPARGGRGKAARNGEPVGNQRPTGGLLFGDRSTPGRTRSTPEGMECPHVTGDGSRQATIVAACAVGHLRESKRSARNEETRDCCQATPGPMCGWEAIRSRPRSR
jgi:hypothetical protein